MSYATLSNYHSSRTDDDPVATESDAQGPVEITSEAQKQNLIRNYVFVAVLVYASWCGPCSAFKPQYSAYARQNLAKCYFARENHDLKLTPGVRGVPSIALYKKGNLVKIIEGPDLDALTAELPPL
jgi:thioredoxin-like negative regulator of GroEL